MWSDILQNVGLGMGVLMALALIAGIGLDWFGERRRY